MSTSTNEQKMTQAEILQNGELLYYVFSALDQPGQRVSVPRNIKLHQSLIAMIQKLQMTGMQLEWDKRSGKTYLRFDRIGMSDHAVELVKTSLTMLAAAMNSPNQWKEVHDSKDDDWIYQTLLLISIKELEWPGWEFRRNGEMLRWRVTTDEA